MGVGATATIHLLMPGLDWVGLASIGLSGFAGGHLADIDDPASPSHKIIRTLIWWAAIIIPLSQFFFRPRDLLLALPVAWMMVSAFWRLVEPLARYYSHAHSVVAAICLSLGVSWVAYLSAGAAVALPAFMASGIGYLLHLLFDDLANQTRPTRHFAEPHRSRVAPKLLPALVLVGRGHPLELAGIVLVGFVSSMALWVI